MNRRDLLKAAPAGFLVLPAMLAPAKAEADETRARLLQVIADLEAAQGWEPGNVAAAKAFAAWQMRKALGLDLPAPTYAQMHVDSQGQAFGAYRRSYQFECDTQAGIARQISPIERSL
jgi:hypothetical protein